MFSYSYCGVEFKNMYFFFFSNFVYCWSFLRNYLDKLTWMKSENDNVLCLMQNSINNLLLVCMCVQIFISLYIYKRKENKLLFKSKSLNQQGLLKVLLLNCFYSIITTNSVFRVLHHYHQLQSARWTRHSSAVIINMVPVQPGYQPTTSWVACWLVWKPFSAAL